MYKVMTLLALLVGLSGCYAGLGVGDSGQHPIYVASDALGSAVAQASIGSVGD